MEGKHAKAIASAQVDLYISAGAGSNAGVTTAALPNIGMFQPIIGAASDASWNSVMCLKRDVNKCLCFK